MEASTSGSGWLTEPEMAESLFQEVDCCVDEPCTAECHSQCGDDCDWLRPVKSCVECSETLNEPLRGLLSPELDEKALQEILECCCCETSLNSLAIVPGQPHFRCQWGHCTDYFATHEELTAHVLKGHLKLDQTPHNQQLDLQFKELEETLKASIRPPPARQTSVPPSTQTLLLEHAAHSLLPPHDPTDHPLLPHSHPHALPADTKAHPNHHHHHHSHTHADGSGNPGRSRQPRGSRQSSLVQQSKKSALTSPYGPYSNRPVASTSSTTTTPPSLTVFGEDVGPSPVQNGTHYCLWEDCPFNPESVGPIERMGWMTTSDLMEHIGVFHVGRGKKTYTCRWADCCAGKKAKGKVRDEDVGSTARKVFTQRQKVMRHIQMHTGDKPFECKICGRSFSESKTLEQHMKGHTQSNQDDDTSFNDQLTIDGSVEPEFAPSTSVAA